MPLIRKTSRITGTPPPRIISLSSNLHQLAPGDSTFTSLEEINDPNLRVDQYYNRSKLAIILYIKAFVKHVIEPSGDKIYALSVHPGAVKTSIQDQPKEAFGYLPGLALKYLTMPFMRTAEGGSLGTLWAAIDPEIEEKNLQGVYVTDPGKVGGETAQADDMALAENVWSLCTRIIADKLGDDGMLAWTEDKSP